MEKRETFMPKVDSMIEDVKALGRAVMADDEMTYEEQARIVSETESILNWTKTIRGRIDTKWPAKEPLEL